MSFCSSFKQCIEKEALCVKRPTFTMSCTVSCYANDLIGCTQWTLIEDLQCLALPCSLKQLLRKQGVKKPYGWWFRNPKANHLRMLANLEIHPLKWWKPDFWTINSYCLWKKSKTWQYPTDWESLAVDSFNDWDILLGPWQLKYLFMFIPKIGEMI